MYGTINPRDVKTLIDQLEAWRILLNAPLLRIGDRFCSIFRMDNKPGCRLKYGKYGDIVFEDWADDEYNLLTVERAYSKFYNVSLNEAIIALYLKAPIPQSAVRVTKVVLPKVIEIEIQYYLSDGLPSVTDGQKVYWKMRGVDIDEFNETSIYKIYGVHSYKIEGNWVLCDELTFAFTFPNGNVKIYRPLNRSSKIAFNTCKKDDIWLWEKEESEVIMMTKSIKDALVLKHLYPNYSIGSLQYELAIPDSIVELATKYKTALYIYDNDATGWKSYHKMLRAGYVGIYYPYGKDTDELYINGLENLIRKTIDIYV